MRYALALALTLAGVRVHAQTVTPGPITCSVGACSLLLTIKPDTVRIVRVDTVIRFILKTDTLLRVDTLRIPYAVRDTLYCTAGNCTSTPPAPPPPPPAPPPPPTSGLPPHPRVWMDASRIARLQVQVANSTIRWTRVKAVADAQVAKAVFNNGDEDKLPDLCLAYLGTGQAKYATRAGIVLTGYAIPANDLKYDSGYGVRFKVPLVTMGLDWCFNGLTPVQRTQAATWLMDRSDWTWPQTNPARAGAWGTTNVKNNYYWGFMMTGPAALAADGLDSRAAGHRTLALQKWNNAAVPFFSGEGLGGAWAEGTNYDSSWRTGSFWDAFATSGIALDGTFLSQSLLWRIHSTMPGGQFKAPLGAQPRDSRASLFIYDRMAALYASSTGTHTGPVKTWLDLIGQEATAEFNETAGLADELLRYNPAQLSVSLSTLPKWYHASGARFFIHRNSWTDPNTTAFVFESGPTADAGARNANGLMIWKGPFWITSTANLYSGSGINNESRDNNNLTVGGVGQYLFPGNGGAMNLPFVSDSLVLLKGQAALAYGHQNEWVRVRPVTDYQRSIAYLPTLDAFVIVDRVTVKDSTQAKVFRWHSKNPAVIIGNQFSLTNGSFSCLGQVNTGTLGTQPIAIGPGGASSSSAVTVTLPLTPSATVVTVLQCGGTAFVPTITVGAQVTVSFGGRTVTF